MRATHVRSDVGSLAGPNEARCGVDCAFERAREGRTNAPMTRAWDNVVYTCSTMPIWALPEGEERF